MDCYFLDFSEFLPNAPVGNDAIDDVLGPLDDVRSGVRSIVLRRNAIRSRHYAIDPSTGQPTHNCAQMSAEAVRRLNPGDGRSLGDIGLLCGGTSTPDQILPGHASMTQGELGLGPIEIANFSGVCISGFMALRHAWLTLRAGETRDAVAVAAEFVSPFLKKGFIDARAERPPVQAPEDDETPAYSFDDVFLRWMLSDGAGAAWMSTELPEDRRALRVEWIDLISYAGEMETCMYAGGVKEADGRLKGWREFDSLHEAMAAGAFVIRQDVRLLNEAIVSTSVDRALMTLARRHSLRPEEVDWFLPHYSSNYFREPIRKRLRENDFEIPEHKWFTNLAEKGNTGSASIYIMLADLLRSDHLRPGERILCFIPESGRFCVGYMLLTVV